MDKTYQRHEQNNANQLEGLIQGSIPDAEVMNMGWLVLVYLKNGGVFNVFPLTSTTCDLNGRDSSDRSWDVKNISLDLKQANYVAELQKGF